jgi:hypothetical protein
MKFVRPILHGLALAAVNIGASLVGFAAYKILGVGHQLAVQISVAVLVSVAAFAVWYYITVSVTLGRATLGSLGAYAWTYVLAFAWFPVLFVPLHYVTQGYLTSFANIYNMWLFQAPTNAPALGAAAFVERRFRPRERCHDPRRER